MLITYSPVTGRKILFVTLSQRPGPIEMGLIADET
jgi:hypothetical protein